MMLLPLVALAIAPPITFDAVLGKGKTTFAGGDRITLDVRVARIPDSAYYVLTFDDVTRLVAAQ